LTDTELKNNLIAAFGAMWQVEMKSYMQKISSLLLLPSKQKDLVWR
jgi:hypothetical protein